MNCKPLLIGAATVIGIAHLGVLGHLLQVLKEDNKVIMPSINLPTGPYSSYKVNVNKQGYQLQYNANDPKVMKSRRVLDLNEARNRRADFSSQQRNQLKIEENMKHMNTLWMDTGIQVRAVPLNRES